MPDSAGESGLGRFDEAAPPHAAAVAYSRASRSCWVEAATNQLGEAVRDLLVNWCLGHQRAADKEAGRPVKYGRILVT